MPRVGRGLTFMIIQEVGWEGRGKGVGGAGCKAVGGGRRKGGSKRTGTRSHQHYRTLRPRMSSRTHGPASSYLEDTGLRTAWNPAACPG